MSWRGEALAFGLGLIAAAYAWSVTDTVTDTETGSGSETGSESETAAVRPELALASASASRRTHAPPSLDGTDPDGSLHFTEDDVFIPTPGAIQLFDYYLTTLGEIDMATVRTLVAADARRFAPDRIDPVLALFDRYVTYLADLQSALSITPDLPVTDVHAVTLSRQRAYFGDDADILFAADNALAAQLLASSSRKSRSLP